MEDSGKNQRQPMPPVMEMGEGGKQQVPETLQLHGSDHPGMILVSTSLTKNNYFTWSYAIKRALDLKMKLCCIDGTSAKPSVTEPFFEHWMRVDNMVTTWILNCISKEIVGSFMYAKNLHEHFG
ncbi:UNVERIFIED_CONTAM: hypothetical protein Sindi_1436600 [Sesamum indicum]